MLVKVILLIKKHHYMILIQVSQKEYGIMSDMDLACCAGKIISVDYKKNKNDADLASLFENKSLDGENNSLDMTH